MVNPLTIDVIPSLFTFLLPEECTPGGGGGAFPDDQEFPPVLYRIKRIEGKKERKKSEATFKHCIFKHTLLEEDDHFRFFMPFNSSGIQPEKSLFSTFLPAFQGQNNHSMKCRHET